MKRLYALRLVVAILMVATFAACSGDPEPNASDPPGGTGGGSEGVGGDGGGGGDGASRVAGRPPVSLRIASPEKGDVVKGNVAYIRLKGINKERFNRDNGDGFAVFVDRPPTAVGEKVPNEADVVRSRSQVIPVPGLSIGRHTFTIVATDKGALRLRGEPSRIRVKVDGPSITATGPRTIGAGEDFTFEIAADGVDISQPGEGGKSSRHYAVLVDRGYERGDEEDRKPIPDGEGFIHTGDSTVTISDLAPGRHVIRIRVVNGNHVPVAPVVGDTLEVIVQE